MIRTTATAAFVAALATGSASAGTVSLTGGAGAEYGVGEVLSLLSGDASLVANSAINGFNGGVVGGSSVNAGGSVSRLEQDRIFHDGSIHVAFSALYWGNSNDPTGTAHHNVFISQNGGPGTHLFSAGGATGTSPGALFASGVFPTTDELRFFAQNLTSGNIANTDENASNHSGTRDRVISFDVTGLDRLFTSALGEGADVDLAALRSSLPAHKRQYLFFVETGNDFDHQDLVFLVSGISPVPTPAAAGIGALGLASLGARRRRS